MISDEISYRCICFVSYCGDHRYRRVSNRPGDLLGIEGPEIFGRTAATAHDQDVDLVLRAAVTYCSFVILIYKSDRSRDVCARRLALDFCRRKEHVDRPGSAANYVQDVTNSG